MLPPWPLLDPLLHRWLAEDLGRGDRTTAALFAQVNPPIATAQWQLKQPGVVAGLPLAQRLFYLLDPQVQIELHCREGDSAEAGTGVATLRGPVTALLTGERVALNLLMHLSGIATLTRRYCGQLAGYSSQIVDTRKTRPGLRLIEKYATQVGGAINHRFGLDDAVMIKDNHIAAAGSIEAAVAQVRQGIPFPLGIEVETESLAQVRAAIAAQVQMIMLDNMPLPLMAEAVALIRQQAPLIKIEASGNITFDRLTAVAATGVDYISTSALITQATWLDYSQDIL